MATWSKDKLKTQCFKNQSKGPKQIQLAAFIGLHHKGVLLRDDSSDGAKNSIAYQQFATTVIKSCQDDPVARNVKIKKTQKSVNVH